MHSPKLSRLAKWRHFDVTQNTCLQDFKTINVILTSPSRAHVLLFTYTRMHEFNAKASYNIPQWAAFTQQFIITMVSIYTVNTACTTIEHTKQHTSVRDWGDPFRTSELTSPKELIGGLFKVLQWTVLGGVNALVRRWSPQSKNTALLLLPSTMWVMSHGITSVFVILWPRSGWCVAVCRRLKTVCLLSLTN